MRTIVLLALFATCARAQCQPLPDPPSSEDCETEPRMKWKQPGLISPWLQDCYVCEGARDCTTTGNQRCCGDDFCSECAESPLWLHRKNGG